MKMWLFQLFRTAFFSIDNTLYNFIPTIYNLLISVSRTTILSQGQIKEFADRVQALIGVFMLFKVSFSLITYIINPDDFSDKAKGFGKLWMNIIITLLLLVFVPYIFSMAYDLQAKLLENNALATLFFGEKEANKNYLTDGGQQIAFSTMIPFLTPSVNADPDINKRMTACSSLYVDGKFNPNCKSDMYKALTPSGGSIADEDKTIIENYALGVERRNLGLTFRINAVNSTISSDVFLMDYKFVLSTAAAIVVILVLITFCMDVALRSVKLAFLQLISPIPIISFIDPKQGKDGMFKKWYQMCFSTYLSLFIRLLGLYFGLYLINLVITVGFTDVVTAEHESDFWIQLFMIIGILMFVKQLPKILEGFGIKLDGSGKFELNPFKKMGEEAMFMKRPMDTLHKARENLHKDGYGIGLGAKKLISGIDSARAGKGFWNGTRKVQGNGVFARASKWYHDLTPNRTEQINKSREAKADLNYKRKLYFEGEKRKEKTSKYGGTIKSNVKAKKSAMTNLFVDGKGNAAKYVDPTWLKAKYKELGEALVEQYGKNNPKNREYARIAVEKHQAEAELRRLNAIQRQSYDPNTGMFKNIGASLIDGTTAIDSAEVLEDAIETQRKTLESISEYASKEKEFQYKSGHIDLAISTNKGLEPRNRKPF